MSDCSTEAMKPKKRPEVCPHCDCSNCGYSITRERKEPRKTCGTCGHSCGHRTKLYGCVYDYVPCLLHGTFEHEEDFCSDWTLRTAAPARRNGKTLEQRCHQLEQVVRDLYIAHIFCKGSSCDGCPFQNDGCEFDFGTVKERLEALGVEIDD